HVSQTSEIRLFKIIGESSVAAGIRRIEAITSIKALEYFSNQKHDLDLIKSNLNNSKQPVKAVSELIEKNIRLSEQVISIEQEKSKELKSYILENSQINSIGVKYFFGKTTVSSKNVKDILFDLKANTNNMVIGIASIIEDKVTLSLMVSDELVATRSLKASEGIKMISKAINGGGGGQAFFATAGGKNVNGVEEAFSILTNWIG
ncbi:DHHA1 domain-containing protein, partial [Salibacteraceae bacterium]|nr:DHHA1 domain-containing protein [Salibacteraceae bacterium]